MADAHQQMAPIIRPPRPAIIGEDQYPRQPESPPTDNDIVESWCYLKTADNYRGYGRLSSTDFAKVHKYHAQITAAHIGLAGNIGVNANIEQLLLGIQRELRQLREGQQEQQNRMNQMAEGFRGQIRELRQGLERIDQRVERIDRRVEEMDRKVDELKDQGNRVEQMSTVAYNRACRDGFPSELKVVRFNDGRDPTHPQLGGALPKLSNKDDINNLSSVHLRAYFSGYFPDRGNCSDEERRTALREAIGCFE